MLWRNRCPHNKFGRHAFDKETHRCKCGKWDRGYAPKKEPVKPRAECQICEGTFACHNGCLGHHGYKRPGWGFIVGDCMGVDHKPFPATDALVKYRESLKNYIEGRKNAIKHLEEAETLGYTYNLGPSWEKNVKTHTINLTKDFKGGFYPDPLPGNGNRMYLPSFEEHKKYEIEKVEMDLKHAKHDLKRVEARIEKGLALTAEVPA